MADINKLIDSIAEFVKESLTENKTENKSEEKKEEFDINWILGLINPDYSSTNWFSTLIKDLKSKESEEAAETKSNDLPPELTKTSTFTKADPNMVMNCVEPTVTQTLFTDKFEEFKKEVNKKIKNLAVAAEKDMAKIRKRLDNLEERMTIAEDYADADLDLLSDIDERLEFLEDCDLDERVEGLETYMYEDEDLDNFDDEDIEEPVECLSDDCCDHCEDCTFDEEDYADENLILDLVNEEFGYEGYTVSNNGGAAIVIPLDDDYEYPKDHVNTEEVEEVLTGLSKRFGKKRK